MLLKHFVFQLFLLVSCLFLVLVADFANILKLCKIECETSKKPNPSLGNFSCAIKAINRFRSAINAEIYLLRPVDNIFINMQVFKKNSVRYLPYMVNVTGNICKFLNGTTKRNYYAKYMINWINKYSNVNHSCPYSGLVYLKDLEPFAEKIPVFVPAGDYRVDFNFYENSLNQFLGVIRGYGTITIRPFVSQGNH